MYILVNTYIFVQIYMYTNRMMEKKQRIRNVEKNRIGSRVLTVDNSFSIKTHIHKK